MRFELRQMRERDQRIDWGRTLHRRAASSRPMSTVPVALGRRILRLALIGALIGLVGLLVESLWLQFVADGWATRHADAWRDVQQWASMAEMVGLGWIGLCLLGLIVGAAARRWTHWRGYWYVQVPNPVSYELITRATDEHVSATVVRRAPAPKGRRFDVERSESGLIPLGPSDDAAAVIYEFAGLMSEFHMLTAHADSQWVRRLSELGAQEPSLREIIGCQRAQIHVRGHLPVAKHLSLYVSSRAAAD